MIQTLTQVSTIQELRSLIREARQAGKRIGFVPTMGYLHEGHASLVKQARLTCDLVVMSIFVNPLQFGPNEDFSRYPRDIVRDREIARSAGVDLLFTPSVEEMYPTEVLTKVSVAKVSEPLCGKSRPGHFDGVATVVMKLFQIVQPDDAFFGQKDAQQVAVIQQMVRDLSVPVNIVVCPIVREADGLAMSSRNVYLREEEREQATILYRTLQHVQERLKSCPAVETLKDEMVRMIQSQPLAEIDYAEILHYPELTPVTELKPGDRIIAALAVRFGKTRLIDNLIAEI
ncbi:pantoate--beta-alanine ligase [Brevibacillus sp. SYP-B805]|uniref:pantoate--beta-alanine ligase n=1 Tax=Brevibacillus sp. SYP-B805 TaxID=1578199 RepID=UPI0013EC4850|nr:pantoate--beta-alanine ligase [Brevibacillus sp. SYP-B805]NGQ94535.1 pantoate--beta-alanine ligase [Brevibacillus sp. SYP-B805]